MRRTFFLAAAAFALAVATPVGAWSQDTAAPPQVGVVGQPAPDIQVQDWINGDGRTQLADFRGDVVFIELWGTH